MRVEIEDKGTLEFPDGTNPAVIDMVVKRDFFPPAPASGEATGGGVQNEQAGGVPLEYGEYKGHKGWFDRSSNVFRPESQFVRGSYEGKNGLYHAVSSRFLPYEFTENAPSMTSELVSKPTPAEAQPPRKTAFDIIQRMKGAGVAGPDNGVLEKTGAALGRGVSDVAEGAAGLGKFLLTDPTVEGNIKFYEEHPNITGAGEILAKLKRGRETNNLVGGKLDELAQNTKDFYESLGAYEEKNLPKGFIEDLAYGLVQFAPEMITTYPASGGAAVSSLTKAGLEKLAVKFGPRIAQAVAGKVPDAVLRFAGRTIERGVGGAAGGATYGATTGKDPVESAKGFAEAEMMFGALGDALKASKAKLLEKADSSKAILQEGLPSSQDQGPASVHGTETPLEGEPRPGTRPEIGETKIKQGSGDAVKQDFTGVTPARVQLKNPLELRSDQFGAGLQSRGVAPDTSQYRQAVEEFQSHLDRATERTGFWPSSYRGSVLKNALEAHHRTGGNIAFANVDLRNLGALNKHRGSNSAADRDIRAVADLLREPFREAGRDDALFVEASKGDEFDIILPNADRVELDKLLNKAKIKIDEYARREGLDTLQPVKPGNAPGFGIYSGSTEFRGHDKIGSIIEQADTETAAEKIRLYEEFERRKSNESGNQIGTAGTLSPGREAHGPQEGASAKVSGIGSQETGEHPATSGAASPEEVTPQSSSPATEPRPQSVDDIIQAKKSKPTYIPKGVEPPGVQAGNGEQGHLQRAGALETSEAVRKPAGQEPLPDAGAAPASDTFAKSKTQGTNPEQKPTAQGPLTDKGALEHPEGDIAAGGLAFGQDIPKYAAGNTSINLERIDADYPVKYLINQVAEQFKGKIDKSRRGEITHEETRKLADDLGMTEAELLSRRKGQAFNAEEATAARDILNTSAKRLVEQQKKAVESGSDADLVNFRLALSRHAAIQAEVSGVASEAGRALSAHRILSKSISQTAKNQKAMFDALGGREITAEIARSMSGVDLSNVAEVNRFIRAFSKVKISDMIFEAWINFLLSGPKTHIVNSVSNTLTYLTKAPETAIASAVDIIRAKMGGTPRERFFGEVAADFVGARVGLIDGVRAALKAFREDMPDDGLLKLEQAKYKTIPGKAGEAVRLPGRFLTAADEFYKSVNYASEIYALAYRKAAKEGVKGKNLIEKTAEYVKDPSPDMVDAAKHEAQYRTFTQPYGKWGRILERARQIPVVRYLVPFMRTPTNIAKFGLERTPMNFARLLYKAKQGEIKGSQLSDELAKPILGSMVGAVVVVLAQDGMITGGGPKDKNERAALNRSGWQPYSLKIGDKYYSYGRLEPIGSIFGMAADYADMMKDTDDKELTDYAENIALSVSKNLTSKTFMQGVSSALDAVSDPRRYGENWIESFAGSVVPSVVNTAAKMIDDTVHDVHGPVEAIEARIPYFSKDLSPKRDLWGREIKYKGNALERGFSPVLISEESKDPVDMEAHRLGINPGMPSRKLKDITLTPIQYDIYIQLAGQEAYQKVSTIINDKNDHFNFWNKNDERRSQSIKNAISDARRDIGKELYQMINKGESAAQMISEVKAGEKYREGLSGRRNFNRIRRALSARQIIANIKAGRDKFSSDEE